MKYTIKDLQEGKCAVLNDGTLEELAEVLRKAFPNYESKPIGNYWCYFLESKDKWIGNNYTDLVCQSVKDFLKEKDFTLPEKWCVKNPYNEESYLLYNYTNSLELKGIRGYFPYSGGTYFHFPNYYGNCITSLKVERDYTEITFKQFKKHILKVQDKKIIGYKVPFDIFDGKVKKGSLYKYCNMIYYETKNNYDGKYKLPKEIVETWEAVYEEEKFPFKLSKENAQAIINIACNSWKKKLSNKWSELLYNDNVEITEDFYNEMRKACTKEQNELFDKIFVDTIY